MQVRAHKARKRRKLEPDSFQLEFADEEPQHLPENSTLAIRAARWRAEEVVASSVETEPLSSVSDVGAPSDAAIFEQKREIAVTRSRANDSFTAIIDRPPLPPFPRITSPTPKIIEFPRMQARACELAEPVADQLRIFEAIDELRPPPTTHLNQIEIAPEEPTHATGNELEVPIQTAPLGLRSYAAAVDGVVMIGASTVFAMCAAMFASSLPMNKPLVAGGVASIFLLVTIYYVLSLCFGNGSSGMEASGLRVLTFSGVTPSRTRMGCRALATVLSAAALGMGFAWSLIDEDQLCWHDRITHTYLTSK